MDWERTDLYLHLTGPRRWRFSDIGDLKCFCRVAGAAIGDCQTHELGSAVFRRKVVSCWGFQIRFSASRKTAATAVSPSIDTSWRHGSRVVDQARKSGVVEVSVAAALFDE